MPAATRRPIELPQERRPPPHAGEGCGPVRPSTHGRWRTLVLSLVWVAMAAHFIQWRLTGSTVTPVEPSEAMQTLEQGLVNAGFVLFGVAILSTLVLGRWFCGWGCHIIALQDLCTWMLKKAGLRPRPLRSRLLVFVPLLAGLYMFVWPSAARWLSGQPAPVFVQHFMTDDFWATFPGPAVSILTFAVCGFLIVYLLGNKGYCTYACPYGGFFGVVDRLAPGRIRVTNACDGCGHCTATCTSNVRVHDEVRRFGMVVNPGCMKCTDCISVCPKDALYYGFGRPAVGVRPSEPARARYDYSWGEELGLALAFFVSLYAFRGLYDAVPFLLALGLSSISAFLVVTGARLLYAPAMQLHGWGLRRAGRMQRAGWVVGGLVLGWIGLVVHSAWVQYNVREAERLLNASVRLQEAPGGDEAAVRRLVDASLLHLGRARDAALLPMARVEARLGSARAYLGDAAAATSHLQRALELRPNFGAARYQLAELTALAGDLPRALAELKTAIRDDPDQPHARRDLLEALGAQGRLGDARPVLETVVRQRPNDLQARIELAQVLAEVGDMDGALREAGWVARRRPAWAEGRFQYGTLLGRAGRPAEALPELLEAVGLAPTALPGRLAAAAAALDLADVPTAREQLEAARGLAPLDAAVLHEWASTLGRAGALPAVCESCLGVADSSGRVEDWYAAAFACAAAGDREAAQRAFSAATRARPGLVPPRFP